MTSAKLAKTALDHVAKLLQQLTEEQLTELAEGRGHIEFRSAEVVVKSAKSKPAPAKPEIDVTEAVASIKELSSAAEIISFLTTRKTKKDELQAIAAALGPTVSSKGTVSELRHNIADGTVGFRQRAAAVGGWDR